MISFSCELKGLLIITFAVFNQMELELCPMIGNSNPKRHFKGSLTYKYRKLKIVSFLKIVSKMFENLKFTYSYYMNKSSRFDYFLKHVSECISTHSFKIFFLFILLTMLNTTFILKNPAFVVSRPVPVMINFFTPKLKY